MKTLIIAMLLCLTALCASAQQFFVSSSPDTVRWNDSVCIVVSNHYPGGVILHRINLIDGSWADRDTLGLGSHWLCPSQECPGLNEYRLEWYDSLGNGPLGDTIVSIYWIPPYSVSPDTITATTWSFSVSTTIPLRILLRDNSWMVVDSAIVSSGGSVLWQGLQPQSVYHRMIYPSGGSIWGCEGTTIITDTLTTSTDPTISTSVKITTTIISSVDPNAFIEVWDMAGQKVASGIGKVDLNDVSSGIYFYRIFDAGGNFLATGKFPKI